MGLTQIIILNAVLDLAVVLAVFAVVRFTHRLHRYDRHPETVRPLPLSLALPHDEAEEVARAA